MDAVTVQFYKNPDIIHWGFDARSLGEDRYGTWLALPAGTRRWKGEIEWHPTREDAVHCIPHDGWWVLHYNGPTTKFTHFVDIATQPQRMDGRVEMIDLDLDVVRYQSGRVEIEDEDEFEEHQMSFNYSKEMIQRAREETDRVVAALRAGQEPFFDVAARWLRQVPGRT